MVLMINLIILMMCAGEYVIDDADHDGAILFRFLSTRFREKAAQSSQGSYVSKPVLPGNTYSRGNVLVADTPTRQPRS